MSDLINRQAAISAICNACGKIDCDKMDKCEKLQLPPVNNSEIPNSSDTISKAKAIDALKQQAEAMSEWSNRYEEQRKGILTAVNIVEDLPPAQLGTDLAEVGTDCVSRQVAIDGKICIRRSNGVEIYDDYVVPVEYLEQLPPAQPKTGKWALQADDYHEYYECDQCGMAVGLDDVRNFCPNCGADMREVTE